MNRCTKLIISCVAIIAVGSFGQGKQAATFASAPTPLEQQLQTLLDRSLDESGVPGAVLLLQSPSFHWVGSSGFADLEAETPLRPSDMLRLASMSKTFVSVVIQKLCEEGKIQLDAPIGEYLPPSIIERIARGSDVTVRQLLDMTSGIYSYTESDDYNDAVEAQPYRSPWTPSEIIDYIASEDAVFAPGTGWQYSNTNYILLEIIVNEVSGASLADEMRRIIHRPLGLRQTFMEIQEAREGGFGGLHVRGYETDGEDVTEIQDGLGLGDGGLISDAQGVATFLQALFVEKSLLNPSSLRQMLRFHPEENYGLGVERRMTQFGEAWGHSGSSGGFQSDMLYFPGRDLIFVVLTNSVEHDISDILLEGSMELFHSSE